MTTQASGPMNVSGIVSQLFIVWHSSGEAIQALATCWEPEVRMMVEVMMQGWLAVH